MNHLQLNFLRTLDLTNMEFSEMCLKSWNIIERELGIMVEELWLTKTNVSYNGTMEEI